MKKPLLSVILFISFVAFIGSSCKKKDTTDTSAPSLSTQDVILDVTATTAQSGGTVSSIGGASLTANGVCYSSSNHTPTIADTKTAEALIFSSYSFSSNLTGLTPSTTYYVRAYATNMYGTGYGAVVSFTTPSTLSSVTGAVTTFAGSGTGGFSDGNGTAAQFSNPQGIAIDAQGNIYISDTFNNRIRKITPDGTVTTIAGNGTAGYVDNETGTDAQFYAPAGLTVDGQGNIYVADYGNNVIRKITAAGAVSTYAGNGVAAYVDGAAINVAAFSGPSGVALDVQGNLYVADRNNNMIRKITAAGVVSRIAGITTAGYVNTTVDAANSVYGSFKKPVGIAVDAQGVMYVADGGNSAIRQITPAGVITTIAGGPGQSALIGDASALTIDGAGDLFISDASGRIIELTSTKTLYHLAGASAVFGYADGSGTAAQFSSPRGIAVNTAGEIYVADQNNNRIRKVIVQVNN
jgi:sugar lactone lactonase YvrE